MTDTASGRQRARMIHNLKTAEIALLEAKLESRDAPPHVERSIENALAATRYAIRRSGNIGTSPKEPA